MRRRGGGSGGQIASGVIASTESMHMGEEGDACKGRQAEASAAGSPHQRIPPRNPYSVVRHSAHTLSHPRTPYSSVMPHTFTHNPRTPSFSDFSGPRPPPPLAQSTRGSYSTVSAHVMKTSLCCRSTWGG